MFTGIVLGTGRVASASRRTGRRSALALDVDLGRHAAGLAEGHSVAIDGVCLTAGRVSGTRCRFEVVDETARLTTLGGLGPGDPVNVERSLRAGDRLEGHFVLGHVDGTAVVAAIDEAPGEVRLRFRVPAPLMRFVARKGSIAIDGASLTVTGTGRASASVSIIPHTMETTSLRAKRVGDRVNVEVDVLARYLQNLPKRW